MQSHSLEAKEILHSAMQLGLLYFTKRWDLPVSEGNRHFLLDKLILSIPVDSKLPGEIKNVYFIPGSKASLLSMVGMLSSS